jgi:hypothetical protein
LVERTFLDGWGIAFEPCASSAAADIADRSAALGVTWIYSYVSENNRKAFCLYIAPSPEAVRKSAALNGLPLDRITEVTVLDPYSRDLERGRSE